MGAAVLEIEQVRPRADVGDQRHDQFLADRVDRGVRDLGEALLEIVVEHARAAGQDRQGRVGAHGTHRLLAAHGHRRQEKLDIFLGVAESLLTVEQGLAVRRHGRDFRRQIFELNLGFVQPLLVGRLCGQFGLDLGIVDDAALFHVDQEHLAGLQAPFLDDLRLGNRQHAHLGSHHHIIVIGDQIAGRPQPVAVQRRANLTAIGEGHGGRAIPGLHQGGMVFIEGTAFLVHERVAGPGLRDQQHHGVNQ